MLPQQRQCNFGSRDGLCVMFVFLKRRSVMRIYRSIVLSLAACALLASSVRSQTGLIPRGISYQGVVINNGVPVGGMHSVTVNYYTAASGGVPMISEDF